MRNRAGLLALVAAVMVIILPSISRADVIFSTMTSTNCACGLSGPASGTELVGVPFTFTSVSTYRLADVSARLTNVALTATALNFFVYSDNGGLPGTKLTTLTGTVPAALTNGYWEGVVTSHAPSPSLTLTSGTEYWLVLGMTHTLGWDSHGTSDLYPVFNSGSGWVTSEFDFSLQYAVDAAEILPTEDIPEPSSLLLVASGLTGVLRLARRAAQVGR